MLVEYIAHHYHALLGAWMKLDAGYGMEAYEIDPAPDVADELDELIGVSCIVVDTAPHYIFE